MSQGVRNRKVGDVFIDEKTNQEYILSEVKLYSGEDYDDLINKLNLDFDEYKIVNRKDLTGNKKSKVKSLIYVELTDKKSSIKYPIIRFFDKTISSLASAPTWSGSGLLKDYSEAYGIYPRLRSALSSQFVYQPSKINFATLLSNSQETIGDGFENPSQILSALKAKVEQDKTPLGLAIKELLEMLERRSYGEIKNGIRFEREIGIYAAEFIVPIAIALGMTTPPIPDAVGGKVKINTKANHMGFDAAIKTSVAQYLISVKQGGAGRSYGAYGSIAYMQKIIAENEEQLKGSTLFKDLQQYKELLDIILGAKIEQKETETVGDLELERKFSSKFTRKTYRNLFILAKKLGLPSNQISDVLKFVGDDSNPLEEKIKMLNGFANTIYDALNKNKFFKEMTKALLQFNNFIQGRLITRKKDNNLMIAGVQVDTVDKKTVDISAKKSYYGSKFASGHGGFLLREILKLTDEEVNNQNQE